MKTNSWKFICIVGLVLGASACSSSDSGDGAPEGEGGGTIALGEVCIRTSQCAAAKGKEVNCQCMADSSETVCVELLEAGDPCGGAVDCGSDSRCVSRNGAPTVCEPYAKLGESCEDHYCAPGFSCESGTCVPAKAIGESCHSFDPQPCVLDAYCEFLSNTCMARAADGEPCSSNDECVEGGFCTSINGAEPTCWVPKADGQPCEGSWECAYSCSSDDDGVKRCTPQDSPTGCAGGFY